MDGWMFTQNLKLRWKRWKFVLKVQGPGVDNDIHDGHDSDYNMELNIKKTWNKSQALKPAIFSSSKLLYDKNIFSWFKVDLLEIYCMPGREFLAFVIMSLWSLCCVISWTRISGRYAPLILEPCSYLLNYLII